MTSFPIFTPTPVVITSRVVNQSSYVYILAVAVFAAGIWLIVEFGSCRSCAEDLAGEWELRNEPTDEKASSRMKIEQSGRFFKIALPNAQAFQMKMTEETVIDTKFSDQKRIVLTGDTTSAVFEGMSKGDAWRLSMTGSIEGVWSARLVERMYPRRQKATPDSSPGLTHAR